MQKCECVEKFRDGERRNLIVAAIAGAMFFAGWWIILDVAAKKESFNNFRGVYYICGVTGTLAVFMVNSVSNRHLRGDNLQGGCLGPCGGMVWLFIGFVVGFASLIASGWILFAGYVIPNAPQKWYGAAVFLQNLFIFSSGLIYRFGRSEELWG